MKTLNYREAGSSVYVGYAAKRDGDSMRKVFGPVTICVVEGSVYHEKGKSPLEKVRYRINSLDTSYNPEVLFDTPPDLKA